MYATAARGPRPANNQTNFRDKRYGVPKLLVDRVLEKTQEPGWFGASVIRVDGERRTLALKFQELPGPTVALLEAAIKKSNAN